MRLVVAQHRFPILTAVSMALHFAICNCCFGLGGTSKQYLLFASVAVLVLLKFAGAPVVYLACELIVPWGPRPAHWGQNPAAKCKRVLLAICTIRCRWRHVVIGFALVLVLQFAQSQKSLPAPSAKALSRTCAHVVWPISLDALPLAFDAWPRLVQLTSRCKLL